MIPKILGKDDVPGDQDLKAGALSTGVGSRQVSH